MIPHSHTDIGWRETIDGYFYGMNYYEGHGGVNMILTTVVSVLNDDQDKKFTWSEIKYFQMWWAI